MSQLFVLASNPTESTWFWLTADVIVSLLLLCNLLLFVGVFARRGREGLRLRRRERFRARFEPVIARIEAGHPPQIEDLRRELYALDELQRPLAATVLLERLRPATQDERAQMRELARECGATELLLRASGRQPPWRRALAIRTLGWLGEERAVPALLDHCNDRARHVRETSVRALGRIGDRRALPSLEQIFLDPQRKVAAGFVYEALIAFGEDAAPVFRHGLASDDEHIRVASCFGAEATLPPDQASVLLEQMLADRSPMVRSAALQALGTIGGENVPELLARCAQDDEQSVRRSAVTALGAYDDPRAIEILHEALADPDRDTVIRAGESLVRLNVRPGVARPTRGPIADGETWPVERASVLASLEVL